MKDGILIIGIVLAFGVGILVGALTVHRDPTPCPIVNYDPMRALCTDLVDKSHAETNSCYELMLHLRSEEIKDLKQQRKTP